MNVLFLALSFSTPFHKSFYEDLLRVFQKNGNHIYVACAKEKRNSEEIGILEGLRFCEYLQEILRAI